MSTHKKVKVFNKLTNRLLNNDDEDLHLGLLLGYETDDTVHVLNVCAGDVRNEEELMINMAEIRHISPAGISVQGIFMELEQAKFPAIFQQTFKRVVQPHKGLDAICQNGHLLVCIFNRKEKEDQELISYFVDLSSYECTLAQTTMSDVDINNLLLFKVRAKLEINVKMNSNEAKLQDNITSEIERVQEILKSPGMAVFHLVDSKVLLHSDGSFMDKVLFPGALCSDLLQYIHGDEEQESGESASMESKPMVIEMNTLLQMSGEAAKTLASSSVPVIHQDYESFTCINIPLAVDTLAQLPADLEVIDLPSILINNICMQLDAMLNCLIPFKQPHQFSSPIPYHFLPPAFKHYVTIIYPEKIDDSQLEDYRKDVHKRLLLSQNRPLFKRANAVVINNLPKKKEEEFLCNTHVGLSSSGVKQGKVTTVKGTYTYHHYMQHGFDDNGWGCAYRSLQTLVSWFRHQGYTEQPIPTHRDIQEALVNIGDKPASFIGSKQWIGSTEVSYVLDHLFGITCKIIYVSSGEEMLNMGRQLEFHFQTQGTPIMIGGGVLAHTIIGVDFSEMTGDTKFLILDPHYTGDEKLSVIQKKGWCGWKGKNFWKKDAYYNMCLPQIPKSI